MKKTLYLGSGTKKVPSAITLDIVKGKNVDVVHDLNKKPYPFRANTFDMVIGEHVIEHVENIIGMMEELYRITKRGGVIRFITPHHASGNAYGNVTHTKFFNHMAFVNISEAANDRNTDKTLLNAQYRFKIKELKITLHSFKWLESIVNRFKGFYDYNLCYFIRPSDIIVEYYVIK